MSKTNLTPKKKANVGTDSPAKSSSDLLKKQLTELDNVHSTVQKYLSEREELITLLKESKEK